MTTFVFLGDSVGKTQSINVLTRGRFNRSYIPTQGFRICHLKNGDIFIDKAGQERFAQLTLSKYADYVFFIFYSVYSPLSQQHAMNFWTIKVKKAHLNPTIFYVATCCDLENRCEIPSDHIKISSKNGDVSNLTKLIK